MIVKQLTEHHLEFLSSKGGCRGSSESTLVKMSNCWKSRAAAHFMFVVSLASRHILVCSGWRMCLLGLSNILYRTKVVVCLNFMVVLWQNS